MNQRNIIAGVIGLVVLCVCAAIFFSVIGGGAALFGAIAGAIEGQGERPPDSATAHEAMPAQVAAYKLQENPQPLTTFYGLGLEDEAYTGNYSGPNGLVQLTLIRATSPDRAATYVKAAGDWLESTEKDAGGGKRVTLNLPGRAVVIYGLAEKYAHIWNSQQWVIAVESGNELAEDSFFQALSYR